MACFAVYGEERDGHTGVGEASIIVVVYVERNDPRVVGCSVTPDFVTEFFGEEGERGEF